MSQEQQCCSSGSPFCLPQYRLSLWARWAQFPYISVILKMLSGANSIMGEHLRRHLPLLRGQEELVMLLDFLPLELSTSPECFFFYTKSIRRSKEFYPPLIWTFFYGMMPMASVNCMKAIWSRWFIFIITIGALAVMSPTHIANIWNQFKQC